MFNWIRQLIKKQNTTAIFKEKEMSKKHRVRLHNWVDGLLLWTEQAFESIEEAVEFANNSGASSAKVFNEDNVIVHHVKTTETGSTYA